MKEGARGWGGTVQGIKKKIGEKASIRVWQSAVSQWGSSRTDSMQGNAVLKTHFGLD